MLLCLIYMLNFIISTRSYIGSNLTNLAPSPAPPPPTHTHPHHRLSRLCLIQILGSHREGRARREMLVAMHQISDGPHSVLGTVTSVSYSAALCCVIVSNCIDVSRPFCRRRGGTGCSLRTFQLPQPFHSEAFPICVLHLLSCACRL